jgi:hypothetical protein
LAPLVSLMRFFLWPCYLNRASAYAAMQPERQA